MNPFTEFVFSLFICWLGFLFIQGSVILLGGYLLVYVLKPTSPATRHFVCVSVVVALLVGGVAFLLHAANRSTENEPTSISQSINEEREFHRMVEASQELTHREKNQDESEKESEKIHYQNLPAKQNPAGQFVRVEIERESIGATAGPGSNHSGAWLSWFFVTLCCIYAGGTLVMIGRLARQYLALRTIRFQSRPLTEDELASMPTFLTRISCKVSAQDVTPMAFGILNPTIVLPHRFKELNQKEQSVVICHEAAHLQRFDPLYNWIFALAGIACWPNPLFTLLVRRANHLSELAADDLAMRSMDSHCDYASALLSAIKSLFQDHSPSVKLASSIHIRGTLESRFESILASRNKNKVHSLQCQLIMGFAILFSLVASFAIPEVFGQAINDEKRLKSGPQFEGTEELIEINPATNL